MLLIDKPTALWYCNDMKKNPHAVALGRLGGTATKGISTARKTEAARRNGLKGGRPLLPEGLLSNSARYMRKYRETHKIKIYNPRLGITLDKPTAL
jgi:hypothetical protein